MNTLIRPQTYSSRRPVPRLFWPAVALMAVGTGTACVFPMGALLFLVAVSGLFLMAHIVRRPIAGLHFVFWFGPVYLLLRAAREAYSLPLAMSGMRLWVEGVLVLIFFGLLLHRIRERRRVYVWREDLPILVYLVAGVYGTVVCFMNKASPAVPLFGWHISLNALFFYFAARWLEPSEEEQKRLLRTLSASFLLFAVFSFADYLVRTRVGMNLAHGARPFFVPPGWDRYEYWRLYPRMQSLLFDENAWGSLCSMISLLGVAHLSEKRIRPVFAWLGMVGLLGVACSMSRGSMIQWLVGATVLLLARGHHRGRIVLLLIPLMVGAGLVMFYFGSDLRVVTALKRVDTLSVSTVQAGAVVSDRTPQWAIGWEIFCGLPSGQGLGTVGQAAFLSGYGMPLVADGIYVRVLAEQGIVGVCSLLLFMLGMGWALLRHVVGATGHTRIIGLWLLAFLCGFSVQGIGANTWDFYYLPPIFYTFYALFISRSVGTPPTASRSLMAREA